MPPHPRPGARRLLPAVLALLVSACRSDAPPAPAAPVSGPGGLAQALPTRRLAFPDGGAISVEVADTPEARERGLMFRTELPPEYGMLFVFAEEQVLQFWMKNTLVSLDMVFIDRSKRVTLVHENVPASARETPEDLVARRSGRGMYVLELPAGAAGRRRLKPGDVMVF